MKTTKRILSLLLCMALVLGMIPVFASAAETTTVTMTASALGIANGVDFKTWTSTDGVINVAAARVRMAIIILLSIIPLALLFVCILATH